VSDPIEREIEPAAATSDASAVDDSFERDLAEFGEVADKPRQAEPAEPEFKTAQEFRDHAHKLGFAADEVLWMIPENLLTAEAISKSRDELIGLHSRAAQELVEMRDAVLRERDRQDYSRLVETIRSHVPELATVTDQTLNALLAGLYSTDQRTAKAWDARYSQGGDWAWSNQLDRLVSTLKADMQKRPDPDATEIREIVSASVRGIGAPRNYEAPPVNYNKMTDQQYRQHLKDEFNIDTR
jgi:hypothetical protein